jgi:hypothetical protein
VSFQAANDIQIFAFLGENTFAPFYTPHNHTKAHCSAHHLRGIALGNRLADDHAGRAAGGRGLHSLGGTGSDQSHFLM